MKLLIVEDDKATIQSYKDNIESFNKSSKIQIDPVVFETIKEAKDALISPDFDAAIVDLKLSANSMDLEGLEIVDEIEKNLRFPIFIVSGSLAQISKEENAFLKKRPRDGNFKEVLNEVMSIYNTGITKILGSKGDIEKYLNSIFWNHLSSSMDLWINDDKRSPEEKQKSLLRYTLLHIQEYLELSEDSDFEDYHPCEIYITPVVKKSVFTGDIVIENKSKQAFIVLTPSCDLAQTKAKDILLVNIEATSIGLLSEKINVIKNAKSLEENKVQSEIILKELIRNTYSNKYHFLPNYKNIEGGLINFQKLYSVRVKEFNDNYSRIASTNSSFTKDIVARFSYYYSRQGSPDFNTEEIYSSLF